MYDSHVANPLKTEFSYLFLLLLFFLLSACPAYLVQAESTDTGDEQSNYMEEHPACWSTYDPAYCDPLIPLEDSSPGELPEEIETGQPPDALSENHVLQLPPEDLQEETEDPPEDLMNELEPLIPPDDLPEEAGAELPPDSLPKEAETELPPEDLPPLPEKELNPVSEEETYNTISTPASADTSHMFFPAPSSHFVSPNIGTFHYSSYLTREQKLKQLRSGFCKCPRTTYAICNAADYVAIHMGKGTDTEAVGILSAGNLCYILADEDCPWVYIESGTVRGFVFSYYLITGAQAEEILRQTNNTWSTAEETLDPLQNTAYRYSLYTLGEIPDPTSGLISDSYFGYSESLPEGRAALLNFAASFTGYPYLWGGDNPYTGTDCSGFVKYVYEQFGIYLPRTAEEQAYAGNTIPVSEALPGDLIFMMDATGYIYHVVIYAGNGQSLEAKGVSYGIGCFDLNYRDTCWAVRLIPDL